MAEAPAKENGGRVAAVTMPLISNFVKPNSQLLLFFGRNRRRRRRCSGRRIGWRICRRRVWMRGVHPILEVADAFSKPAHHFGNFLAPEEQHDDRQHD